MYHQTNRQRYFFPLKKIHFVTHTTGTSKIFPRKDLHIRERNFVDVDKKKGKQRKEKPGA